MTSLHYFAYGSNMLTRRLRERVPSANPIGRAHLPGLDLSYTKLSLDGSGKATLCRARPTASGGHAEGVHGVVFELEARHMPDLERAEESYWPETVRVELPGGKSVEAVTFHGQRIDPLARPYYWYVDLVVAGAREHGLPESFILHTLAVRGRRDPDPDRAERHRLLLDRPASGSV